MKRTELEKPVSLRKALFIAEKFYDRQGEFNDEEIHRKKGIVKIISEEYLPLVELAKTYIGVRSVRLFPNSNQGPDGEIRFWWRLKSNIQITCASENYQRALMREQLANQMPVFPNQTHRRTRGGTEAEGRVLMAPSEDLNHRLSRIVEAIERKNEHFYEDTDTLLVQDELANFRHLNMLHQEICRSVQSGYASNYKRVFVVYGSDVKRAK